MVRIGVLGASGIAPLAIVGPAKGRADCEVVCVAARDGRRARDYADAHGIPEAVGDYATLIARDDIDLVYNGLMHDRHADLSIAAAEAGKAVLCEKPFAMNAAEAEAMAAASARTGRPVMEAFHYRHHPAFAAFADAVRAAGAVRAWEGMFEVNIPPESTRYVRELGGGAVMDLGCYPLHALRQLAGEAEVVAARAWEASPGVDRRVEAELDFGGVPGRVTCDMGSTERRMVLAADTVGGRVEYANFVHPYRGYRIVRDGEVVAEGETARTTFDHQLDHVVAVMEGRAEPLTGGADAVANMRLIDAVYRAAGMEPRGRLVGAQ